MTTEQYNQINKAAIEDALKEGKRLSVSAFAVEKLINSLNGNTPPTKQETIQETKPDVPKPAGPITSFNDIEI